MKILIPAAGKGSRFERAGYTFPKPLIDVDGKPMISRVVENFRDFDADFIFLVQREHAKQYEMEATLDRATGGRFEMITLDGITAGAACTALLAAQHIRNDELIIANSDQLVRFSSFNFKTMVQHTNAAGIIFCFNSTHPKWSFVKCNSEGAVTECAEKKPISDMATCGIYYWRLGSVFVGAAEQMIRHNERVNGEFYICPVYNEVLGHPYGEKVLPFMVDEMHGLGTPEDLRVYLDRHDH